MKILLIVILLVSSICATYGQRLGLQAGVRINTSDIDQTVGVNRKAGFEGGLFYRYPVLTKHLNLRVAILYFNHGFSLKHDMGNGSGISYHFVEDNLKLPLNIEWQVPLGKLKPFISGGLYSSYSVSGKRKDSESDSSLEYRKSIHRMDYGLNIGLGVYLTSRIALSATYEHGFAQRDLSLGTQWVSVKNRGCSVLLNYLF